MFSRVDFGGPPIPSAASSFCKGDSGAAIDCGDATDSVGDADSSSVGEMDSSATVFSGVLCLAASVVRHVSSSCSAGNAVASAFVRRSVSVRLCANGMASRIDVVADSASIPKACLLYTSREWQGTTHPEPARRRTAAATNHQCCQCTLLSTLSARS